MRGGRRKTWGDKRGGEDTEECTCSNGSVPVNFELCDTRTGCEDVSLQLKKEKKCLHH